MTTILKRPVNGIGTILIQDTRYASVIASVRKLRYLILALGAIYWKSSKNTAMKLRFSIINNTLIMGEAEMETKANFTDIQKIATKMYEFVLVNQPEKLFKLSPYMSYAQQRNSKRRSEYVRQELEHLKMQIY